MRHRHSGRQLNRNSSHRKAMFRNMTISLVEHELIKTTLPKAKELRGYAEPLITLAKNDSVANRRLAFDRVRNKEAVGKLFSELRVVPQKDTLVILRRSVCERSLNGRCEEFNGLRDGTVEQANFLARFSAH